MSYRLLVGGVAVSLVVGSSTFAATSKTYKKPATVPTLRLAPTTKGAVGLAIPSSEEITRATALVRDTFKEQYKPAPVAKRKEFARELLRQGIDTRDDAAARYVLLDDAANIAAAAGDAPTASRAVDELARSYQIDPIEMKLLKLADAAKSAFTRDQVEGLVLACVATAEAAIVDERYDPASRLLTIADAAAERGKQVNLRATVTDRKRELELLRATADEYARARQQLDQKPADPDASLTCGRFLCLVKGDWDKGLPLLAAGNDEKLKSLAVKDIESPADSGAKAQVGAGWWDLSTRLSGVMRSQSRKRAVHWYRQALPTLAGVNRKMVEENLKEMHADRMRDMNLSPGLVAELFDGQKLERKRLSRVDPAIDFDWDEGPLAEGMAKDNFSATWTGHLNIPHSGQYTFVVIANDGAAIDIDGITVFDKGKMAQKRTGERFSLRLDEGLHPFKMRFWDGNGLAKLRLLWLPPGTSTEVPIPADIFCHEDAQSAQLATFATPSATAR